LRATVAFPAIITVLETLLSLGTVVSDATPIAVPSPQQDGPAPPGKATALRAVVRDSWVTLTWRAPAWDGGSAITNYIIWRVPPHTGVARLAIVGNILGYTDTTVTKGVRYFYQVSAVNEIGQGALTIPVAVAVSQNRSPTAKVSGLTSGANVSGTLRMSGTASDLDDHLERVEVQVDNGTWQAATGTRTWTFELDTTTLLNGPHLIGVRAFDGIDYSDVVTLTIAVDNPRRPLWLPILAVIVAVAITRFVTVRFGRRSVKTMQARSKAKRVGAPPHR